MKLLHTADLHFGKRVNGLSMANEQRSFVEQIVSIAKEEKVAGVLIAGDVFDRPHASRDALEACDLLFSSLNEAGIPVFVIPGNHDSATQLSFCAPILASSGINIAKPFSGAIEVHELSDGRDAVRVHMLPFVRPTDVRMGLPDLADGISSHDDAVRAALSVDEVDPGVVNILLAHQFVTGAGADPETCESELISVGGSDNVDVSAFDAYDYVALGHLHGAQSVGRPEIRYSGSPLKYSLSEMNHDKSVTILSIEDGSIEVTTRGLVPLHDMREVSASYEELAEGLDAGNHLDYMHVVLTDSNLYDAMAKLRALYPNILRLDWSEPLVGPSTSSRAATTVREMDPVGMFEDFYAAQTNRELDEDSRGIFQTVLEEALHEAAQA